MEPNIRDWPDFYLGWVIQPMNWEGTEFYVYPLDDTYGPKSFLIKGTKDQAMSFIENRSKFA